MRQQLPPLSRLPLPHITKQNEKEREVMLGPERDPDAEPKFDTCHTRPAAPRRTAPSAATGAKLCRRRRRPGRSAEQSKGARSPAPGGGGWDGLGGGGEARHSEGKETYRDRGRLGSVPGGGTRGAEAEAPKQHTHARFLSAAAASGGAPGVGAGGSRSWRTRPPHK